MPRVLPACRALRRLLRAMFERAAARFAQQTPDDAAAAAMRVAMARYAPRD